MIKRLFLLLIFSIPLFSGLEAQAGDVIKHITVEGNVRVSSDAVKSYMSLSVGDKFDKKLVNESLKRVYQSNLFSGIVIERSGDGLVIKVEENPKINKIAFEGNKRVKSKDLQAELVLRSRMIYTKTRLQDDVNRIIELYNKKGRFSVVVAPKIIKLSQNRLDLVFEITEGPKAKIDKIFFVGNKEFGSGVLSSIIMSKESRWYKFFSSDDKYNPARIEMDKELLNRFYHNEGYADLKVLSVNAQISKDRESFYLTFNIDEGPKFKFGSIKLNNDFKKVSSSELKEEIKTVEGETYNGELIEKTLEDLSNKISDLGYAFLNVEPEIKLNNEKRTADITYNIEEGHKVYLNKINIKGNVRTADKVIRREFRIAEGDPFNATKILRSQQRIEALGYFDKASITTDRTEQPDKFNLNVDLEEKSTASINLAGGYDTVYGLLAKINFTETNLFGNGQQIGIGISRAKKRIDFDISFTEPYFLDKNLSAGIDVYSRQFIKDESRHRKYSSKSRGFSLRAGYEITEHLLHSVNYSYSKNDVFNISDDASVYVKDQKGKRTTSSIGQGFSYDNRDSPFQPTKGYLVSFSQAFAGLGGKVRYLRHTFSANYYKPLMEDKLVLMIAGEGGTIKGLSGKKISINDRFFLGGENLRGFEYGGVGPRDKDKGDSLGGNHYIASTIELKLPIKSYKEMGLFTSLFLDAGTVWGIDNLNKTNSNNILNKKDIRSSVGIGIGFNTPVGPIRLNYGVPIRKQKFDKVEKLNITLSTKF